MKARSRVVAWVVLGVAVAGCGDGDRPAPVGDGPPPEMTEAPAEVPAWLDELAPEAAMAEPQAMSFFGEELYAQRDEEGLIASADAALAIDPEDPDLLLAAGRARRHAWHFREAIELYTRALEEDPMDWRPYRFRGHRHISLRDFDQAVADLEVARERAPLNWDVAYHLGLAYFLAGDFGEAAEEYLRCLGLAEDPAARDALSEDFRSCAANSEDPESLVAMTDWAVRALLREDRGDDARNLLDELPDELPIETNVAYHHLLELYRGEREVDELLDPDDDAPYRLETVGYGVANRLLVQGDTARALGVLREVVEDPTWPGFGRIAAEVELARLDGMEDGSNPD